MRKQFIMFYTIPLFFIIVFSTSVYFYIKNWFPPSEYQLLLLNNVFQ